MTCRNILPARVFITTYLCTFATEIIRNIHVFMKNTTSYLLKTLLLVCLYATPTLLFAQSGTYQTIPQPLRGYWQFKTDNVTDWNSPLIGENFVEFMYTVFYAEQMEKEADGSYHFHLRNEKGEKMEFRFSPTGEGIATLWYQAWKEPKICIRKQVPEHTVMLTPTTLPETVYQKWVKGLTGDVVYEFTRDGKLLYDGKTWDILSAGYFLNKEYRLLAKSGERYRLIYLSFPFPGTMNVAAELGNEKVTPIAAHPEVYKITGCWVNATNGDWTIGFFEHSAVYQCKFWDYESIRTEKGKTLVSLKNGKERLTIKLERGENKNSCSLAIGKEKAQPYILCNDYCIPDYPLPDTTPYINNGYQTDSVTLVGYLRNLPSDRPFEVTVPDMITQKQEDYHANIDSLGRFIIRFPVLNSHNVFIDWGRTTIWTTVEPGETYFLYVDFAERKRYFMGNKARVLNELLAYPELREYINYDEGKKMSNLDYLHKIQEIIRHKSEYREKILREHPLLSHKYRYYTENQIRYSAAGDLMQRRFAVNRNNQERLEKEFMTYVDSAFYQHPVQPYTLLRDYASFMRDYIGYIDDIMPSSNMNVNLTPQKLEEIYLELEAKGKITLTEEEKSALRNFCVYQDKINELPASKADSLAIIAYTEKLKPIIQTVQQLVDKDQMLSNYIQEHQAINSINRNCSFIDSLQMDSNLREILKTTCYYEMFQHTHKELPDALINKFKKEVSSPSLQSYVLFQQEKYETISNKNLEHPESLMPNEPLAEITDGEQLFRKIIEPYKGKVIYLDIWGTWCGPCKDMMQYAGNIKKLFAGKDVVFLYLCNHSSDKSWKNIIKEYGLTGKSAVHYNLPDKQQSAIETYLGVRSFPTYMLIDKEGNIVNRTAPRPSTPDELLNAVYKELDK